MKFAATATLLLVSLAAAAPTPRDDKVAAAGGKQGAEAGGKKGNLGTAITDTVLTGIFNPTGLAKPIGDIVSAAT